VGHGLRIGLLVEMDGGDLAFADGEIVLPAGILRVATEELPAELAAWTSPRLS
jgi:hypothetical protein